MRCRILAVTALLAALMGGMSLASRSVAAQQSTTATWTAPRTAWGDPDLQGKWTNANTGTPLERRVEFGDREFLTDEELADKVAAAAETVEPPAGADPDEAEVVFPDAKAAALPHEQGIKGEEYNRFWIIQDPREVIPWKRTSFVIEPPDGRIPPLTLAAVERLEAREAARAHRGEADSWEDRNLGERCISAGRTRFTADAREILQAPGYVVIRAGSLNTNEPLVVPLDARPSLGVRTWMGESRGRWEGETLVVETTNFIGRQDGGPVMPKRTPLGRYLGSGETLRVIERFTRVSPNMIEYSYTVDDPMVYVRPYTVLRPLTKETNSFLMPESACHEGNYGIVGQLSAARVDEPYALEAAREEAASRRPQLQEMRRRAEEWMKTHGRERR